MDTIADPVPDASRDAIAMRLARLRHEMDRIIEAEYDPWRYEPGLWPEDLVPAKPHD